MRPALTMDRALRVLTPPLPLEVQKQIFFGPLPFAVVREPTIADPDDPASFDALASSLIVFQTDDDIRTTVQTRCNQLAEQVTSVRDLLFHINKPNRLDVLRVWYTMFTIDADDYNAMLRDAWIATEFPHQMDLRDLVALFDDSEPARIMCDDEHAVYRNLPKKVRVYRGTQTVDAPVRGLSWTLNVDVATWFATRYGSAAPVQGTVYTAEILRSRTYAYFSSRSEGEIVLNPRYLRDVRPVADKN